MSATIGENSPKTLEEHREFLYDMVKLKLFFLHKWLSEHPSEGFSSVIRNRVDIYRKTAANPGPLTPVTLHFDDAPWLELENAACAVYERLKSPDDRAEFERQAFEVFKHSIDERCERDFTDRTSLSAYQCGSLRYETALQDDGQTVYFHIANAICPHSIFEDPGYLPECFSLLLNAVEDKLGATRIACHSWLNDCPKWVALFPAEWACENMSKPLYDVAWHYGFWGQFISSRGVFNHKYGKILRQTGRFPFYPRGSSCSIESMRKQLCRCK